jgi:hypothetical protein
MGWMAVGIGRFTGSGSNIEEDVVDFVDFLSGGATAI